MKEPKIIKNYPLLEKRLGMDKRLVIVDSEFSLFSDDTDWAKIKVTDPERDNVIAELGKSVILREDYHKAVKITTKDYWVFRFSMASVDAEFSTSNDRPKSTKGSITVSDVYDEFIEYLQVKQS